MSLFSNKDRNWPPGAVLPPNYTFAESPKRHPSSQRFHDILKEIGELHDLKQKGYGTPEDPFANVRQSERWGIPGWVGCLIRGCDKISRLQTYYRFGKLVCEAVRDAFLDLATYVIIGLVLFEEKTGQDRIED